MVILGLGSNMGDRLAYLRQALRAIKQIPMLSVQQVSPVYISDALLPNNAPSSWNTSYLNLALRCETELTPLELLHKTKAIEKKIGEKPAADWGPRYIDIDLLAWDNLVQYDEHLHIPHEHLHERPFALWPLADVAPRWIYPLPGPFAGKTAMEIAALWGSRFNGDAPLHTKQIEQRIDTPELVGIVNLTPDSFSDGGAFADDSAAFNHLLQLVQAGALIIDLGAEATGPKAAPLDPDLEWQRLEPILKKIIAERGQMFIPPKISIDTRHADVAKKALALGVDWINDVSGLDDSRMRNVLAENPCDIVFMHHLGIPVNQSKRIPLNEDPVLHVYQWAEQRLIELSQLGIKQERLIFDIGIGYGKTAEQSAELIKNIDVFQQLGVRLLVGHSRKSFLSQFTDRAAIERDIETMVISLFLAEHHVDYLRLHNVDLNSRAFKIMGFLMNK